MAKKKGKCVQCGRCCISCDLMLGQVPEDKELLKSQMKWINLHHCNTWLKTTNTGKTLMMSVPITCVNLEYNRETKKYVCRDYKNRPQICKDYKCYE